MTKIDLSKHVASKEKTFLDLVMKVDSEECYTNMLYWILNYKDCINKFIEKFGKNVNCENEKFTVNREYSISGSNNINGGRIDVCAESKSRKFSVIIENKVFSALNGVSFDENNMLKTTQLSVYYEWAKKDDKKPICFITCPNFRINEIETEIEPLMKGKYVLIGYKEIAEFIKELKIKNFFSEFAYYDYLEDIINSFKRFSYEKKSELFEKLFLEQISSDSKSA